jgi:hypothetical protein
MDCLGDWDRFVCLYVDADAASSSSMTLWLRTATCSCRATFLHLSLFLALLDVEISSTLALFALSDSNFSFVCLFSSFNDEFYVRGGMQIVRKTYERILEATSHLMQSHQPFQVFDLLLKLTLTLPIIIFLIGIISRFNCGNPVLQLLNLCLVL